jgi:orotidine-5'-phosphate decarboxylase
MSFSSILRAIQRRNASLLCIGLDTDIRKIPKALLSHPDPITRFNTAIIDATKDLVCAYKLNLAFYESLGERSWATIRETLAQIPAGVVTIGDAKWGDIGNSSEMYAHAMFESFAFSACTVHPYMGEDSVRPFAGHPDRGVFVLALTSNPGARDFQYLRVNGKPLYAQVVARVKKWDTKKNMGLVIGATRPQQLKEIRALVPTMPLLIPGIGAQGGDLRSAVHYGCDVKGEMAVINASRSIIYASGGEDFAHAARRTALALREEINAYRARFF